MRKIFSIILILSAFVDCSVQQDEIEIVNEDFQQEEMMSVDEDGISTMSRAAVAPSFEETDALTEEEVTILLDAREDKRLACELFAVFAEKYPKVKHIARIAKAEATHIACLDGVLEFYELEAGATEPGVFGNEERQNLYNGLMTKSVDTISTYCAMSLVEEMAVVKYRGIKEAAANVNIEFFSENMFRAATNHLKAVLRELARLEGTYVPSYLTEEEVSEILDAEFRPGHHKGDNNEQDKPGKGGGNNGNHGGQGKSGGKK